ncbi:MAG TPA: DUF4082 domain-containing protein [Bacteroidales bacterium]|nr:DUF4082 domain-containing protein [Bacteroidales bacterium]HQB35952.1 DUF4082 domain-containing protein [Bacteroidales bacterium]
MRKLIAAFILISLNYLSFAQIDAGRIGNDQLICYGYAPEILSFTEAPSGGLPPYSYRWQRSNDRTTWSDITGTTASRNTYSPPVLGRNAWFRCRVSDAANVSEYTNAVAISVSSGLTAGLIGQAQSVYNGGIPLPLTEIEAAEGGSESYTYQWQMSSDGLSWSNIPGAVTSSLAPSAVFSTTFYRRLVSDGVCGGTIAGNSVRISVDQITLYTTETPFIYNNEEQTYNLGTEFRCTANGYITRARLFTNDQEEGEHIVRLWMEDESGVYETIAGPFAWNFEGGYTGWREFDFPSPIAVQSGMNYIISITNVPGNYWYAQTVEEFSPLSENDYIEYIRGVYNAENPDNVPTTEYHHASYFRDVVFSRFSPGSIGYPQSICYNTVPEPLVQISNPSGGSGPYYFQWQQSSDNMIWSDIPNATSLGYSPPALTENTYYRRSVTSGGVSASSSSVLISVGELFSEAQLYDDMTIYNNTAANFRVVLSGGTGPFTINYTRNGEPQASVQNYSSGADIFTGVLTTGTYFYELTSVFDVNGCIPASLGTSITLTVVEASPETRTNKAYVIVNRQSSYFSDYTLYIKPYLDNFGIPYDEYDQATPATMTELTNYAIIIFGHRNVYDGVITEYPLDLLENAVSIGVGLYSLDPHLFDYQSDFTVAETSQPVSSSTIDIITSPVHYITETHIDDDYNQTNDIINLLTSMTADLSTYTLNNPLNLAFLGASPLLVVSSFGNGRIVKWNGYDWVKESVLGPVYGMDDLIWRSIVWSARKPFVMQGLPPMVTMRVDDVDGAAPYGMDQVAENFQWIDICNEYNIIPWCGTFNDNIPANYIPKFRNLINGNLTTASPHAFSADEFIYYNLPDPDDPDFNAAANVSRAIDFYLSNNLNISKLIVPHYYVIEEEALQQITLMNAQYDLNIEFLGTHMDHSNSWYSSEWLNCGPYRIDRYGRPAEVRPVYYGDYVDWVGFEYIFNCVTEIRDDGGYEWSPSASDIQGTINRGVRHLRRAMNSMVLPTLFTHDDYLEMSASSWRTIISGVTSALSSYAPEYRSMDYAVQYIRAKSNISITNVTETETLVNVTYSGSNDMDTKCYLFTGSGNQITHRIVTLPMITSGSVTISILK